MTDSESFIAGKSLQFMRIYEEWTLNQGRVWHIIGDVGKQQRTRSSGRRGPV